MTDYIPSLKLLSDYNNLNNTVSTLKRTDSFELAKKSINTDSISYILEFEKNKKIKILNPDTSIDKRNLQLLIDYILKIKILTLRVATLPSLHLVNKIYVYLQQDLTEKFILQFIEQPEILGGAIIEYSGKNYDKSLLKNVNSLYESI
ncbi:hypothetical protein KA001_02615 [Patescibacteria group bacterium]|nr:hypothetical protein [Patescibacteria group bacterium]